MLIAAWFHPILAILFAFVAIVLMLVILLQRGRGVGLAGAFGGAGGQSAFGAKTGDFLTWATIVIAGIMLLLAVLLNYAFQPLTITAAVPTISAPAGAGASELIDEQSPPPAPPPPPASAPASSPATPTGGATPATPTPETPASSPAPGGG